MSGSIVIRSLHVALPDGARPAAVRVREGRIESVLEFDHPEGRQGEDLGESWLLPGLVDTHVHINEPGRTDWEGFETATADSAGNQCFHDASVRAGDLARPVLLVGSHLDSVRQGGRHDGAYGVIAGLVLAAEHRKRPGLPVVGFVTAEEEQSRFDAPMMGARRLLELTVAAELDRAWPARRGSRRAARAPRSERLEHAGRPRHRHRRPCARPAPVGAGRVRGHLSADVRHRSLPGSRRCGVKTRGPRQSCSRSWRQRNRAG